MSDDHAEQRQHPRVDLLQPPTEQTPLPGWVFQPVRFNNGPAGLVLNISDGGLQVLTSASEDIGDGRREVVLLLGQQDEVTWFNGVVERSWTRPLPGFGNLHGFKFVSRNSTAEKFLLNYKEELDEGHWVRCVLLAVK